MKLPTRKCLATYKTYNKNELFRVVKTKDNSVILDISGKANGRGAYIYKSLEAIEIARKSKVLDKALETTVPNEVYDRMILFIKMK